MPVVLRRPSRLPVPWCRASWVCLDDPGLGPTVAFALLHVPLNGWHVVPLDLAVGLGLGGLRVATRSVVAPAAAHAIADLATWWV